MANYNIRHTDRNVPSIPVIETEVNDTALDVDLFGRINPEYGERLDQNLLNILEHFACPELITTTNMLDAAPDIDKTSDKQLSKPTPGQFWYNSTRQLIYFWSGEVWTPTPARETYAANWGSIMDGQQLPRPVSPISGYTFGYSECIWSVSPAAILTKPGYITCGTDANAVVTMQYRPSGVSYMISGLANYLIIGIGMNTNGGVLIPPFLPTPTPSPTISSTPGSSVTPTPSLTATPVATPPVTPSLTAPVTPTPAATSDPTPTITISPTRTPTPLPPTPTPTPTGTPVVSVTPTPSPGPLSMMCDCQGAWQSGSGYLPSYGNYSTLAECELNVPSGSYRCESGGTNCYQIVRSLDPYETECSLIE